MDENQDINENIKKIKFPSQTEIDSEITDFESTISSIVEDCKNTIIEINKKLSNNKISFDASMLARFISELENKKSKLASLNKERVKILDDYGKILQHASFIINIQDLEERIALYKENHHNINQEYFKSLRNSIHKIRQIDKDELVKIYNALVEKVNEAQIKLDALEGHKKQTISDDYPLRLICFTDALEELCSMFQDDEVSKETLFLFLLQLLFAGELEFKLFNPNFSGSLLFNRANKTDESQYSEVYSFKDVFDQFKAKKVKIDNLQLDCFSPHSFPYIAEDSIEHDKGFSTISTYRCLKNTSYPNWVCILKNNKKSPIRPFTVNELPLISNYVKDARNMLKSRLSQIYKDDEDEFFKNTEFLALLFSGNKGYIIMKEHIFTQYCESKFEERFPNGMCSNGNKDSKIMSIVLEDFTENMFSKRFNEIKQIGHDKGEKIVLYFLTSDKKSLLINENAFAYDSRFSVYYEYLNSIIPIDVAQKNYPELFLLFLQSNGINLYYIGDNPKDNYINIPFVNSTIWHQVSTTKNIIKQFCSQNHSHNYTKGIECFLRSVVFERVKFMEFISSPNTKENLKKYIGSDKYKIWANSIKNLPLNESLMTTSEEISKIFLHLLDHNLNDREVKLCRAGLALRYHRFSEVVEINILRGFFPEKFNNDMTSKQQADASDRLKVKIKDYLKNIVFSKDR